MPMNSHHCNPVLYVLLIAWISLSGSIGLCQNSPEPVPPSYEQPSLRKFAFKHAKSADVLRILQQFNSKYSDGIAVDERTNSLIFKAYNEDARDLVELCKILDTETPSSSVSANGVSIAVPALGPTPLTLDLSIGFASDSVETLQKRYSELEQKAHQFADKLKQSTSLSESDRIELQQAVRKSFEARQAMQRAELADLAQRMKSMQQSIDARDKLADKVIERRVEDLLNPNLKWDVTRTSTESTRSIAKEDFISPSRITSSQEMQAALQGNWAVRVCQMEYEGDDRVSQVVIRGDLLLVHTIVDGKVLVVSPWRLVWPNAERPYELGVIWDPNSNAESNLAAPGRIAYDGKSFQLAFGKNPIAICPGEDITYIDCVRDNIDDRSMATQTITPTLPKSIDRPEPNAVRQPIAKALWEIVSQVPLDDDQKPLFGIVVTEIESFPRGIDSEPKEQLADFKEEIREQIVSELKTFAHLTITSRKVAEATLTSLQLKPRDLILPGKHAQYFEALKKEGQPAQFILFAELIRNDSTNYFLALELMDRSGRSYKSTAEFSKANPENSIAVANSLLLSQSIAPAIFDTPQALLARVDESSKAGSYAEFISLFSDEGVRDLAGSMLMQAVMQTRIDELSRQLTFGGVAEDEPNFMAFRKVLQRWLPQSVTTAQQEAMGKGLSRIMSSTGGGSPDHAALNEFVISLRESVAGIGDHRKFSIEIMQAFERRTNRKFVFFGNADHENEWQISPFGDRAIATLIDGSPGMATTITLQQANGTWRISSLFNERIIEAQPATPSPISTTKPKYSGQPISWWLDSYWDNAMASPKAAENIAQEYVASEAIRKLREKPECKAAIEAVLAKWFASVEHEVNEGQLTRAAKCFVTAAGPEYQELAVDYLFKIWKQLPTLSLEKQIERLGEETDLNDLLKQLVLNDELANKFAERLTNGTSGDRSLVTYYLFFCTMLKDEKDPKVAELNTWLHHHRELFVPAFTAALKDESEQVRLFSLSSLVGLDQKLISLPSTLTILTMVVESDSSPLIRYAALEALMAMDIHSELVHKTLMEWAKSDDHQKVEHALDLTLRNYQEGNRPQSIDELIELLSDPEWGTRVEINYNNWSTHHRWARQYALAILGEYSAHAHRAIPTLEAELARNNKNTLSFATKALDSVRGYCPDLPIEKLQGEWEFVSVEKPEGSMPFFDLQASSDQQPASVITIRGTQLKMGDRVLAEISHPRLSNGVALLLDPDGKKLHCSGRYDFNAEYLISSSSKLEWVKLEVRELLDHRHANEESKQTYEFRPLKSEAR